MAHFYCLKRSVNMVLHYTIFIMPFPSSLSCNFQLCPFLSFTSFFTVGCEKNLSFSLHSLRGENFRGIHGWKGPLDFVTVLNERKLQVEVNFCRHQSQHRSLNRYLRHPMYSRSHYNCVLAFPCYHPGWHSLIFKSHYST